MALAPGNRLEQKRQLVQDLHVLLELAERQLHVFEKTNSQASHMQSSTDAEMPLGHDPLLTHRQRWLCACFNFWGVIGLGRAIYSIAVAEDLDEARVKATAKAEAAHLKQQEARKKRRAATARKQAGPNKKRRVVQSNSSTSDDGSSDSDVKDASDVAIIDLKSPEYWLNALKEYEQGDNLEPAIAGHKSWTMVIKDFDQGVDSRLLFYNAAVGAEALLGFVMGDLPRRMQEPDFKLLVGKHIKCRTKPGTYSAFVAVSCPTTSTQFGDIDVADMAGRSLSVNQFEAVFESMELYIDLENPKSEKLARKIDAKLPGSPDIDYEWQRRYGGGGNHRDDFRMHFEWIANFRKEFLAPLKASLKAGDLKKFDVHLQRCLTYAGLAQDVSYRVSQHGSHGRQESPLFGLFTATVSYEFGDAFAWEAYSYQVYKTAAVEDIGIDEIGTSIITSAYPWDCGLSYVHAGDSLSNKKNWTKDAFLSALKENALSIHKSGLLDLSIQDAKDKITRLTELRAFEKSEQTLYAQFEQEADKVYSDISDLLRWEKQEVFDLEEERRDQDRLLAERSTAVQERDALADIMRRLGEAS